MLYFTIFFNYSERLFNPPNKEVALSGVLGANS